MLKNQARCPDCGRVITFSVRHGQSLNLTAGATTNCPLCGSLLKVLRKNNRRAKLVNFDQHMRQRESRWPANGQGTKSIG